MKYVLAASLMLLVFVCECLWFQWLSFTPTLHGEFDVQAEYDGSNMRLCYVASSGVQSTCAFVSEEK